MSISILALAVSALLFSTSALGAPPPCPDASAGVDIVQVSLRHRTMPSVPLSVPKAYFGGPISADVTQNRPNIQGGEQERIWLVFDYPSMCPKTTASKRSETLYLATAAARNPSNIKFWQFGKDRYVTAGQSEYEIEEFKLRPDLPIAKVITDRVFYFAGDKEVLPTIIKCPMGPDDTVMCVADVEFQPNMGGELTFRKSLMPQWRAVVTDVRRLVDQFAGR